MRILIAEGDGTSSLKAMGLPAPCYLAVTLG
jgi:hypothetical protein